MKNAKVNRPHIFVCGQTVLPDRSISFAQKLMKNAKIENATFLLERNRIKIRVKIVIFFFEIPLGIFLGCCLICIYWLSSSMMLLLQLLNIKQWIATFNHFSPARAVWWNVMIGVELKQLFRPKIHVLLQTKFDSDSKHVFKPPAN